MTTNYPASVDSSATLPTPTPTSPTSNPSHAQLHANENSAIEAIEGYVGTYPTLQPGDTSSITYQVQQVAASVSGKQPGPLTGDVTTSGVVATLASVGPGATGPIGSASVIPVITIDAKGRVTGLASVNASGGGGGVTSVSGTAGDITVTNGTTTPVIDLATLGASLGPTGSASVVPVVTVDTKGRVTALTSATITPAAIGALGSSTPVTVAQGGTGVGTLTGLVKGNGASVMTAAVAGTDYLTPSGSGAALTGITESQVANLTTDLAAKAPLASPALTGNPTAPTQSALNNSTKVATTAYADTAVGVETTRAEAAEALLGPIASPTFTGVATSPVFSASGLTGATAGTRYIGAWAGPGAPASGTFSQGDFGIDRSTPTIWVCTTAGTIGSGCVFTNIATLTSLTNTLLLPLTSQVNYQPQSASQGNTALMVTQNETFGIFPPVASTGTGISPQSKSITGCTFTSAVVNYVTVYTVTITTSAAHGLIANQPVVLASVGGMTNVNGTQTVVSVPSSTTFTFTTTSAVSGTYTSGGTVGWWLVSLASSVFAGTGNPGKPGDTFSCQLAGFLPSGYNVGDMFSNAVPGVVLSSTTLGIAEASSPGTVTQWGQIFSKPEQYTNTAGFQSPPRGIIQIEGTNTFNRSVDVTYGIGPVLQNVMNYTHRLPYTATFTVTNGSNLVVIAGDQRANVFPGDQVTGTGVQPGAYAVAAYFDGTNTTVTLYDAVAVVASPFEGTTGTASLSFSPFIAMGEGLVNSPTIYAYGAGIPVSFPLNRPVFAAPGQGQGWATGYWSGPLFTTVYGGTLNNVNLNNFMSAAFTGPGTTLNQVFGYVAGDVQTNQNAGNGGTALKHVGITVGHLNNDNTLETLFGAQANVGIVNASTEFTPGQPGLTFVASGAGTDMSAFAGSGTVNVISTNGFMLSSTTAGFIKVFTGQNCGVVLSYTGTTSTSFTGCTYQGTFGQGATTLLINGTAVLSCASAAGAQLFVYRITGGGAFNLTTPYGSKFALVSNGSRSAFTTSLTIPPYQSAITAMSYVGTKLTVTCAGGHSLVPGSTVTIPSGTGITAATGTWTVLTTGITPTTFQVTLSTTPSGSFTTSKLITCAIPYDGQKLVIVNANTTVGSTFIFTSSTSTGLSLGAATRTVDAGGSLSLCWDQTFGRWIETGFSGGAN